MVTVNINLSYDPSNSKKTNAAESTNARAFESQQSAEMSTSTKVINLMRGWPAPELLPGSQLSQATQRILSDPAAYTSILEYGPDKGYLPLRKGLSWLLNDFYRSERSLGPDVERICITGGASQNLANVLQSFTDPVYTRGIWIVAPCYYLACGMMQDGGFSGRLRGVSEGNEGVDLADLEFKMAELEKEEQRSGVREGEELFKHHGSDRKFYRHVIYCVPTCSNPSGTTMSLRAREGLVQLARKYDALIVSDDVYDFLQWEIDAPTTNQRPAELRLPRLVDIDLAMGRSKHDPHGFGHAISNGSFSKIASPGLRTGWVEASPAFVLGLSRTASTVSGGAPSQFAAAILSDMIQQGHLQEHIEKTVRPSLQRRHKIALDAIRTHLSPLGVTFKESSLQGSRLAGGYFIWFRLEDGISAKKVTELALSEEGLIVGQGNRFCVIGDEKNWDFDGHLRLCFAWESEQNLVEGIQRLGRIIRKMRKSTVLQDDALRSEEDLDYQYR